jgi:hypothetical protein
MAHMTQRSCERCKKQFQARTADVNRGWGRFCSKSCKAVKQSATKREELPQWLRDEFAHEEAMDGATSGWDEGGWLSDDSGCESK